MNEGGVILYPTDTIWGIGCDATNEEAVRRVYEIKQRSDSKAMLVLVDSPVKVDFYVQDVPEVAWDLIASGGQTVDNHLSWASVPDVTGHSGNDGSVSFG